MMTSDVRKPNRFRQTAALLWSGLILSAVLILSRRAANGFVPPFSSWPLIVVTGPIAGLSVLAWLGFRLGQRSEVRSRQTDWIAGTLTMLPTILSGIGLLPAQSPFAIGWLLGLAGLLVTSVIMAGDFWTIPAQAASRATLVREPALLETPAAPKSEPISADALTVFDPVSNERSDPNVTQWMTRQSLPDGSENLEGAVRIVFAAGQRAASIHIPFTPPFATAPQVECEIVSDEPARWKVSVVYAYGMRVELKRDHNAESAEVELAYSATCQSASLDAA